jgi:hypothetical protein
MAKCRIGNSLKFIILAPSHAHVPRTFTNRWQDTEIHEQVLGDMQRMRGRVALQEEAIRESDLDNQGRYRMPGDENSWHLIRMTPNGKVKGCARVLVHSETATFSALRLSSAAVARNPAWADQVRWSVESEIASARKQRMKLVEPGGWVLEEEARGSSEAISIALSAFAWSQLIGDCLAFVTATVKHRSSSMLRRLGGDSLFCAGKEIPKYFDPAYQCEMELLKLQTRAMNPKFESMLAPLRQTISTATVLQPETEHSAVSQWVA